MIEDQASKQQAAGIAATFTQLAPSAASRAALVAWYSAVAARRQEASAFGRLATASTKRMARSTSAARRPRNWSGIGA